MWPEICSEGTTYDVAFAAAPYLAEFAQRAPTDKSVEYLLVLGLIVTEAGVVPADLEPAYSSALTHGLALALERLSDCPIDHTLRYLLAAVAALRGRADLASALQNLDAVSASATSVAPTSSHMSAGSDPARSSRRGPGIAVTSDAGLGSSDQ